MSQRNRGIALIVMTITLSLIMLGPPVLQASPNVGSNVLLMYFPHAQAAVATNYLIKATSCLNEGARTAAPFKLKIAVIEPIFTATPYSQFDYGSFYAFYHKYGYVKKNNITTDLNWLNTSVSSGMGYGGGWGLSYPLYEFLSSQSARNCGLVLGSNVFVISDVNVTEGALFYSNNGSSRYNVVIVGFSEYVTSQEYDAYRQFVSNGGTLILMDSDSFQVKVGFSASSNHEWLVSGHGWNFNGKTAWHGVGIVWEKDDINWVGSTLCCFHRFDYFKGALPNQSDSIGASLQSVFGSSLFTSYTSHEENGVRNMSDTSLIATFVNQSGTLVASYIHNYKGGSVVCFCVFGDDIISHDRSAQYFLILAVGHSLAAPTTKQTTTRTIPTVIMSSSSALAKNRSLSNPVAHFVPTVSTQEAPYFESRFLLIVVVVSASVGLGHFLRHVKKYQRS